MSGTYKKVDGMGWVGWRGVGWGGVGRMEWGGWLGRLDSWRQVIPSFRTQASPSISDRNKHNPQDGPRQSLLQQFGTAHILITAIHWLHRLHSAPS